MPITDTTTLPDVNDLTLDASVEDEFTANWPDVTNYGQYDIQYKDTGDDQSFTTDATVGESTTTEVIGGLEDGEKYDVRVRSRTEHVTGDWFTVTAVTLMPTIDDFAFSGSDVTALDAGWTDPVDNEDGIRVFTEREADNNPRTTSGTLEPPVEQQDLSPNTTTTTISDLDANRTYRGYVEIYTEHVFTTSNTDTATTDVRIEPDGWQTVLTDPDGDKWTIRPDDVIDIDLNREHTAMSDYALTVPYSGRAFEYWATAATKVEHYYNGVRLFYGYLERADGDERQGAHVLEGRGILRDLTDVPIAEHFAATETADAIDTVLSQTEFNYTVVPSTNSSVATDEQVQDASTTTGFGNVFDPAADQPYEASNGELTRLPSSVWKDGFDRVSSSSEQIITDQDGFESRDAIGVDAVAGSYLEWTITAPYDIPEDRVGLAAFDFANDSPAVEWTINGNICSESSAGLSGLTKGWRELSDGGLDGTASYTGGDISAGETVTIRVETTGTESGDGPYYVDVLALHDKAQPHQFDDTTDSNDRLARPAPYAAYEAETVVTEVTPNVTDVRIDSTWNSVTGTQALFVSNDAGASYEPPGGDPNTSTTDQSLDSVGTRIRAKVEFGGYGTQSASPTENPNPHKITDWNVYYDGDSRSVIDDSRYEGSAMDVLQKLHKKAGRRMVTPLDGTKTLESFPTGEVTKTADWTAKNRRPTHDLYDYANAVTVYGARQDDGTRPVATAKDQDEINRNGAERRKVIRRTDLDTLDAVKSEARSQVVQRTSEKQITGRLEVWPTDVLPGYAYDVDWYGDGQTVSADLERLSIRQGYSNDSAELRFERDRGNDVEIVQAKYTASTLGESL